MYELFYKTGACSRAVHVLLNEIGTEFTLSPNDSHEPNSRLLKANPRGQVPTLVIDGEPITEGGAIMSWLADEHKTFLPASGIARAQALQWLAFANSSLHPIYSRFFGGGEAFAQTEYGKSAQQSLQKLWDLVEVQLGKTKYLAGDEPTVGDILTTVIGNWKPKGLTITLGEKTKALFKTMEARPAYKKAVDAETHATKSAAA